MVRVSREGFQTSLQSMTLRAGTPVALRTTLSVASLSQSVTVDAQTALVTELPTSQTHTAVSREEFKNSPAITVADIVSLMPGVSFVTGNGPRDIAVSVRGSSTRQTYGVRNVQVFEDGFPVTQPDGLARMDLTDPHAYSGVDVVQGPSSALYGNYATGGAINFHTRSGSDIHGVEVGADFGSFGYFNDYVTYGTGSERYQLAVFLSNVRAEQATSNNQFNTITANILASFAATPRDRMTFKFINNNLDTNLSIRLSRTQYALNPYQRGCAVYSSAFAVNGCASVSVFTNGFTGTRQSLAAAEAGLNRHDRRTIVGARYEHDVSADTTWQTQFVWDDRVANQPTSASAYRGTLPSFNVVSDRLRHGKLGGKESTTYVGGFFNYENISSTSANLMPGGNAAIGAPTQTIQGDHFNTGFHLRAEYALAPQWTLVAGVGGEYTQLAAVANNFTYTVATSSPLTISTAINPVRGDRNFFNVAPEFGVQYRPTSVWKLHGRIGTGYGTPQATQLFTTPQGLFGNNTTLKTQRNIGVEGGADLTLSNVLTLSGTIFYEWFRNEMVTQSPGVNLQSFTFNAPASAHRGVELGVDLHPLVHALPGLRMRGAYTYDNQIYTNYTEQLTSSGVTASFARAGLRIPGVQPHTLNARILYDQPSGMLRGFGGYLEDGWRDAFYLDNGNLLKAPGNNLLNLSLHYDPPAKHGLASRLRFFFDLQNLANVTYVASAGNITNTLNAAGQQNDASVLASVTGSIYAGTPRASYGGVRLRF